MLRDSQKFIDGVQVDADARAPAARGRTSRQVAKEVEKRISTPPPQAAGSLDSAASFVQSQAEGSLDSSAAPQSSRSD